LSSALAAATTIACDDAGPQPAPSATSIAATPSPPAPTAFAAPTQQPRTIADLIGVRAQLPDNDPGALAMRYGRLTGPAPTSLPFAGQPAVGSTRQFVISRLTGGALSHTSPPQVLTITATLHTISEHAYFYADDTIAANSEAMQAAADLFETSVWPTITGVFGEPDMPGIDGDPRIIVLQADVGGVAGYFSSDDTVVQAVRPLSNQAEMVYLDSTLRPGGATFNVVLAHELQHLIHDKDDGGDEAWVNEGLSETALLLAGGAGSTIDRFEGAAETQLNAWPSEGTQPHYGAAAAFFRYTASRLGGDAVLGGIARETADGPAGVDAYLATEAPGLSFRDLFADWIVANVVEQEEGPYANPDRNVEARVEGELAPGDFARAEAHQFGTDYYGLVSLDDREYTLHFEGAVDVAVLPPGALSEGAVLWSNFEDDVNTHLTYAVDLTGTTGASLTFRTWFDIEPWYDWGYVSVSTDGGATWTALPGEHTTYADPLQVAVGPGYHGTSGGGEEPAWVDERIDLSAYSGPILIRFEYVTDGGVLGEGWAVRDVRVSSSDGSVSIGDPHSTGWLLLESALPQTYAARLIITRDGGAIDVLDIPLDSENQGELRFDATGAFDAIVAIAGTTEGTRQPAPYTIELSR
jgi:hypothetical protein